MTGVFLEPIAVLPLVQEPGLLFEHKKCTLSRSNIPSLTNVFDPLGPIVLQNIALIIEGQGLAGLKSRGDLNDVFVRDQSFADQVRVRQSWINKR